MKVLILVNRKSHSQLHINRLHLLFVQCNQQLVQVMKGKVGNVLWVGFFKIQITGTEI